MDWNDLKAFEAVARAGSLTLAAQRSDMSIATLSRRLEQLETSLGLRLVVRTPAGMELTSHGSSVFKGLHDVHDAVDAVLRLSRALKSGDADLPVRISATETVTTTILAPAINALRARPGAPSIDFIVSNENADLTRREAELAIRLAAPAQDTLVAKRLGIVATSLFASPAYMTAHNPSLSTLQAQTFILYDNQFGDIPETVWAAQHGFAERAAMVSSSTLAILEAVKTGMGIGLLPEYLARRHGLVRIDCPTPPARALWLVFHKDEQARPQIKAVRNWISESFRQALSA
jgi:DNA-binding transcriptional LysR family regulator